MKFTTQIEINKPIDKVVQLFDNPENLQKWMEGLIGFQQFFGVPGHPGAKSKLKFRMGSREIEMIETITVRNLPHEFTGTYETNGVFNTVSNRFEKISETSTRYLSESEFHFTGVMKVIAFLMPRTFKKQSMKHLQDFKKFVESQP
ncbi:MAG TPA: SRPBCC family protein [Flavobacterium sp.]|jgi:uncharacterized membrane protein